MFVKSTSKKPNIKNIITLNVYGNQQYIYKSKSFKPLKSLTYNKLNFITSYVSTKDMINTKVYISRTIPEEDILDIIDIKAYEELGLDEANSYIISSTEVFSDGEDREFHIFVVETEVLDTYFEEIKEKTKFIDLITPAPLLFKPLYTNEILQASGVQGFVYFTRKDAFVTFYKNGEYLYSKSMEYSLGRIYDKYCELVGEKVEEDEFYSVLISEGLKTTKPKYHENLMKIFGDIFIAINDVVIYTKRAFQLESIDHIYIGSALGPIIGLDEYGQNYLALESSELNFDYGIQTDEWYTDQLQYLMLLNAYDYLDNDYGHVNLTMYPRPPSFANRSSGQFIIATAAAISLSLIYPMFYLLGSYTNDTKNFMLKKQDEKLTAEANKYKEILGKKKATIKKLDEKTNVLSNKYDAKTKTLTAIYDKKVNYRLKSEIFHTISNELNQFDVNIDNLYSEDDSIWISMIGSDERKLTELIKYISDKHFKDIKLIDIERIDKNTTTNHYKGLLKVELK
jgi:hypothetical protein